MEEYWISSSFQRPKVSREKSGILETVRMSCVRPDGRCLQEITYLTSPGALNPLPDRSSTDDKGAPKSDPPAELRPQKALPEDVAPAGAPQEAKDSGPSANGVKTESPLYVPRSQAMSMEPTARPPSSPSPKTVTLPDESNEKQILTAIYRPDSKAAWREELRAANEQAEKVSIP
jgi:striatin 1/3/4